MQARAMLLRRLILTTLFKEFQTARCKKKTVTISVISDFHTPYHGSFSTSKDNHEWTRAKKNIGNLDCRIAQGFVGCAGICYRSEWDWLRNSHKYLESPVLLCSSDVYYIHDQEHRIDASRRPRIVECHDAFAVSQEERWDRWKSKELLVSDQT